MNARHLRFASMFLLAGCLAWAPGVGLAQDEDEDGPAVTDREGVDPLASPAAEGEPQPEVTDGRSPFPRVADQEETIYAVQRKAYLVEKRIELTPMFAATFSDRFVQTLAPAASITYHVAENFGIELFGAAMFPSESDLTTEILNVGKLTPEVAKLTQMLWAAGLGAQWSPIYGKLQLFGRSLGNFSFYIGVGAGIGQTRVQCTSLLPLDPNRGFNPPTCPELVIDPNNPDDLNRRVYEPARLQFMGAFSGGVRFYFSNTIGLKFELKDYVFATRVYRPGTTEPTQRFTDAIRNNIFAQIGLSFLLGGEAN
jgi:outer membrane beta-barrel protein